MDTRWMVRQSPSCEIVEFCTTARALKRLKNFCAEIENKTEARMIVGYGRVSTDGQTLETQITSLKQAGAEKVYAETVSGVVTDRRELAKAISSLTSGDLLVVTKLDRLARSTRDLLNTIAVIT